MRYSVSYDAITRKWVVYTEHGNYCAYCDTQEAAVVLCEQLNLKQGVLIGD